MTPDEIRRSWDDDDTPRSVFPEPLAERLTRENKELRAEVERWEEAFERDSQRWVRTVDRVRSQSGDHCVCGCAVDEPIRDALSRAEFAEARLGALVSDLRGLTYAGADGSEFVHRHGAGEGEVECPACWVSDIRAVLDKHAGGR